MCRAPCRLCCGLVVVRCGHASRAAWDTCTTHNTTHTQQPHSARGYCSICSAITRNAHGSAATRQPSSAGPAPRTLLLHTGIRSSLNAADETIHDRGPSSGSKVRCRGQPANPKEHEPPRVKSDTCSCRSLIADSDTVRKRMLPHAGYIKAKAVRRHRRDPRMSHVVHRIRLRIATDPGPGLGRPAISPRREPAPGVKHISSAQPRAHVRSCRSEFGDVQLSMSCGDSGLGAVRCQTHTVSETRVYGLTVGYMYRWATAWPMADWPCTVGCGLRCTATGLRRRVGL
jgi:hypothetical protein